MTGKDCSTSTSSSAGRLCKPVTSGSVGKLAIGVIAERTVAGFGWIVVRFLRPRRQQTVRSLIILRIVAFHSVGEMSLSRRRSAFWINYPQHDLATTQSWYSKNPL
jgi:hypothetical protein